MPHRSPKSSVLFSLAFVLAIAGRAHAEEPVKAGEEPAASARPWDTYYGGIVAGHWTVRVPIQFGSPFSTATAITPALGVSHAFTDMIELGMELAAAFPTTQENDQWQAGPGVFGTFPLRISIINSERVTGAIRFAPGFGVFRNTDDVRRYIVPLQLGLYIGYRLSVERFTLGLGLDSPMYLVIDPIFGTHFVAPILLGPVAELRLTPWLSLFADLKFGIHIETYVPQTFFSQRIAVGLSANF